MSYLLDNRVVLVTGASTGIGRACAVEFHRAGCRVVVTARSSERLDALADELGDRVLAVPGDLTRPADRDAVLETARRRFGPVDVLVNNAGWASFGSTERVPFEDVSAMLELNLAAPIALAQALLPEMRSRGHGQIINIASVVGFAPMPWMSVYSATKAALIEFSAALRQELRGTGVDIILVAPGSTRTGFFDVAGTADVTGRGFTRTRYTPQRVARAVVRASRARRREVILSGEGKLIAWIRRFTRRGADRIMRQAAKRRMPRRNPG